MDILGLLLGNPLSKKIAAKRGFTGDIMELLGAIGTVGQPSDPAFPPDLLPMGARLYGRGMFTLLAVQPNPDWVWPFFIVRQFDPHHKDFVGRGHSIMSLNTTHRNWTAVGCIGSKHESVVDTRGLVTPRYSGWSVDIWLAEGQNLYAPSRMDTVRQYNASRLPIVRTVFEAAGHEVQSDVFAAKAADQDCIFQKVTIRNNSAGRPVSMLYSLRPYNPEGLSVIKKAAVSDKGFSVNSKPAVVFLSRPAAVDCSNEADGDVSLRLGAKETRNSVECRSGLATALAKFEVAAKPGEEKSFWFIIPVEDPKNPKAWAEHAQLIDPESVLQNTQKLWREHLAGTIQIDVPDEKVQRAFDINKAYLLLLWDGDEICPGPFIYHHFWFRDAAFLVSALDKMGFHNESRQVLETYPKRQREDGFFISQNGEWDANGQAMWTLLEHYRYTRDLKFLEKVYPSLMKGAKWIETKRMATTTDRKSPVYGLLPAGFSAEHFGPNDYFYWDDFWCLAGVRSVEEAAAALGKNEDVLELHQQFDRFLGHIEASLAHVEKKFGKPVITASPHRRMNSGAIGSLCTMYPLHIYPADDARMAITLKEIRKKSFFENGFFQNNHHSGVNAYLTFQFAQCLLQMQDPEAWVLYRYILELATQTWTWPEAIHPRTLGGVMGDGHHGWAVADFLHLTRNFLLFEDNDDLVVFPMIPAEWVEDGKQVAVREAPTHFGRFDAVMKTENGRARVEFNARYHTTPEKLIVCFPKEISTLRVDGKDETLQFSDRVQLPPDTKSIEVSFA